MESKLKKLFADTPEVELGDMDTEDSELFNAMQVIQDKEKSGKIALRIPKSLHNELANAAKEEGVSLNQYCLYKLAQ